VKITAVLAGLLGFVLTLAAGPTQCVQATMAQYIAEQSCLVGNVLYTDFGVNLFPPFQGVLPPFSPADILVTPDTSLLSTTRLTFTAPEFHTPRTGSLDIQLSFRIEPQAAPPVICGEEDDFFGPPLQGLDSADIHICSGDGFEPDGTCNATNVFLQISDQGVGFPPFMVRQRLVPVYELGEIINLHLGPNSTGEGFQGFGTNLRLVPEPASAVLVCLALTLVAGAARHKAGKPGFHFLTRL